jgi:hypothetical protein
LTAIGLTSTDSVDSDPVTIDVEPQFTPIAIDAKPVLLNFTQIGSKLPLRATGTFADGSTLDVTRSTRTSYTSNNSQVATVDGNGIVTAVAPGQTFILVQTVSSSVQSAAVMIQVPEPPPSGTPPVITGISPTHGIPGSTHVTITGSGFGQSQGSGSVLLGKRNASQISSWSDTQIVATIPTGSRDGVAEVSQNGLFSNDIPLTMDVPQITGISPSAVAPGMQMTITGTGFGTTEGSGFVATANTNGNVVSWSDTQIVITIAPGTSKGQVYVQHSGVNSAPVNFTMIPPVITSISPTLVAPGMQMTITGTGFGATEGSGFVATANTNGSVVSWSDTQIVITLAQGTSQGQVYVQQGGVISNQVPYTLIAPVISSISPTQVAPGTHVTITGTGFGATQNGFVATANTNADVISWSDTQIIVSIVQGTSQGSLYVQVGGVISNQVPFTLIAPDITSISPTQVAPGTQVTITGTGFGAVQNGFVATANTNADTVSWSDTQIVATITPGTSQGNLYVQVGGVISNQVPYTLVPPVITGISPTTVVPGGRMTITGTGFEATQNGFVATANTNGNVVSWSDTQIVISIAPGTASGKVYVQVGGVISNQVSFTVSNVSLASIAITPANATIFNGQSLQYQAIGTYSDGSTADLTSTVTWTSSDNSIVTITNGGYASAGGSASGSDVIGASFGSTSATASLTVQFND